MQCCQHPALQSHYGRKKKPRTKGVRAKPKDMKNARCAEWHFPQGSALSCLSSFATWGRGAAVGRTTTFSLHIQHWSAHLSDRHWASGSSPRISPAHASPWRTSILGSGPMLLSGVTAQRPEDSAETLKLLLAGNRRGVHSMWMPAGRPGERNKFWLHGGIGGQVFHLGRTLERKAALSLFF